MTQTSYAVFLSYASEDAEAAGRIADGLRAAGIEVWFDKSELRGGDAWERQIRQQIHDCRLFVPIVSANSDARAEGYFRREWRLAVDRTHDLSDRVAFLVPVAIDSTPEQGADVPDAFLHVQWTRLPNGETPPAFVERVRRLLSPQQTESSAGARRATAAIGPEPELGPASAMRAFRKRLTLLVLVVALTAVTIGYLARDRLAASKRSAPPTTSLTVPANATPGVFAPPPHSVAVLPFVNMSGDPKQEYFSDGLTEELLNSLTRINGLQVAARTSSFSFKGKDVKVATIARELNVGAILEGSIRRSGQTVRITVQLINAVTGFHLWSQTYDRHLRDVLQLQTDIASAVASALKVTLLYNASAQAEVGGTRNPAALDAYLRGLKEYWTASDEHGQDLRNSIAAYTLAIDLDPDYALALAGRSLAHTALAEEVQDPQVELGYAQQDAKRAVDLAPALPEAHLALGAFYNSKLDIARTREEFERALALAPGSARALRNWGRFEVSMGHFDAGTAAVRRAAALDPLNPSSHYALADVLSKARRFDEARAAHLEGMRLDPTDRSAALYLGLVSYLSGNADAARLTCEPFRDEIGGQICLALAYHRLGRVTDATAMFDKAQAFFGKANAYGRSQIYAQWGSIPDALNWLEIALRKHDTDLLDLKTDPLMDPLRKEPRYLAVVKALKFPE